MWCRPVSGAAASGGATGAGPGDLSSGFAQASTPEEVRVEKGSYVLWSDRLIMRDKTVSPSAHYFRLRLKIGGVIRYGVLMQTFLIPHDTSLWMAS